MLQHHHGLPCYFTLATSRKSACHFTSVEQLGLLHRAPKIPGLCTTMLQAMQGSTCNQALSSLRAPAAAVGARGTGVANSGARPASMIATNDSRSMRASPVAGTFADSSRTGIAVGGSVSRTMGSLYPEIHMSCGCQYWTFDVSVHLSEAIDVTLVTMGAAVVVSWESMLDCQRHAHSLLQGVPGPRTSSPVCSYCF